MSSIPQFKGLISPVYTPMHDDYSLNLDVVPEFVDYLIHNRFSGLFVNGSTGEFCSLTMQERKEVAEAYIRATDRRIPVIVNCGSCCAADTRDLVAHAASSGADGACVIAPFYFRPESVRAFADFIKGVATAGHGLPLWLYHAPGLTGSHLPMVELLSTLVDEVPEFAGVKFTNENLYEFERCIAVSPKIQMLFGRDEMLLGALAMGARAAIGTTYNYLPRLYNCILDAFNGGRLDEARGYMDLAHKAVAISGDYGLGSIKCFMKFAGIDMGPMRPPVSRMSPQSEAQFRQRLAGAGLDCWIG